MKGERSSYLKILAVAAIVMALSVATTFAAFTLFREQGPEVYAIVEGNGTVVLCYANGRLAFADRCAGTAELSIVQPIEPGPLAWRTVRGTIVLTNDSPSNPQCALGRAEWDRNRERVVHSGRTITALDLAAVRTRAKAALVSLGEAIEEGLAQSFSLDLDGDGSEETIYASDNVALARERNERSGEPSSYVVAAAVLTKGIHFPIDLYAERGEYEGGTDAIGEVAIKGVVRLDPASPEIALLVKGGNPPNPGLGAVSWPGPADTDHPSALHVNRLPGLFTACFAANSLADAANRSHIRRMKCGEYADLHP